jgi:cyclic pyranopterin phosphate synthase
MPSTGVKLLPRDDLLTTDEIERVARIFVANGVRKIRLTGGEPTIRKDLVDVVGTFRRILSTPLPFSVTRD